MQQCLRRNEPGPYQIQAAIAAVHSDAPSVAATDWDQIVRLYDQLAGFSPSPVVALNRAVAVAEVEGPQAALALVDGLDLDGYHVFHAVRADLLRRLGRDAEATLLPTRPRWPAPGTRRSAISCAAAATCWPKANQPAVGLPTEMEVRRPNSAKLCRTRRLRSLIVEHRDRPTRFGYGHLRAAVGGGR